MGKFINIIHVDFARKVSPWLDFKALFQLICILARLRPHSIHSITPKAGLLSMLAGWLSLTPFRLHTFTGQVWATRSGLTRFLLKAFDSLTVFFATAVFADSLSQCRFLEDEGVVKRGQIKVIGKGSVSGVDLARFRPDPVARAALRCEIGIADTELIFLFVGRLVRDKGVFDLVEAFGALSAKYKRWGLWIVGPDEDGIRTALEAEGKRRGVSIQLFGPTLTPEAYMAAADVFVLPSYREGFGSVIIEAGACGIPSVAYRIDGVIDAIVDGSTGLLVERRDIKGLSHALERLGSETITRREMGSAARHRAINNFSSSSVSSEWLDFYCSIIRDINL